MLVLLQSVLLLATLPVNLSHLAKCHHSFSLKQLATQLINLKMKNQIPYSILTFIQSTLHFPHNPRNHFLRRLPSDLGNTSPLTTECVKQLKIVYKGLKTKYSLPRLQRLQLRRLAFAIESNTIK